MLAMPEVDREPALETSFDQPPSSTMTVSESVAADRAASQPDSTDPVEGYTHQRHNGTIETAVDAEDAMRKCTFLGGLPLKAVSALLELHRKGNETLAREARNKPEAEARSERQPQQKHTTHTVQAAEKSKPAEPKESVNVKRDAAPALNEAIHLELVLRTRETAMNAAGLQVAFHIRQVMEARRIIDENKPPAVDKSVVRSVAKPKKTIKKTSAVQVVDCTRLSPGPKRDTRPPQDSIVEHVVRPSRIAPELKKAIKMVGKTDIRAEEVIAVTPSVDKLNPVVLNASEPEPSNEVKEAEYFYFTGLLREIVPQEDVHNMDSVPYAVEADDETNDKPSDETAQIRSSYLELAEVSIEDDPMLTAGAENVIEAKVLETYSRLMAVISGSGEKLGSEKEPVNDEGKRGDVRDEPLDLAKALHMDNEVQIMPPSFEDYATMQFTNEKNLGLKTVTDIAEIVAVANEHPPEVVFVQVGAYYAENEPTVDDPVAIALREVAEVLLESADGASVEEVINQLTPELMQRLLVLMDALGYKDPEEVLVHFVLSYNYKFLLQAVGYSAQHIMLVDRDEIQPYGTAATATATDGDERLVDHIGRIVFQFVGLRTDPAESMA